MQKDSMRAVSIDHFGDPEMLLVKTIPVPRPKPNQVLIKVKSAGIGIWEIGVCKGLIAKASGINPEFPWVLGSEGAGEVVATGDDITKFKNGDFVYGINWIKNPKRGFFAEYTAQDEEWAELIPSNLQVEQAGALWIDGVVAYRGIAEVLALKPNENVMIFGAGGGIGHLAVQMATRMGAHVFAIASGEDGVALAKHLGAEAAVEGHEGDIIASAREFAPDGFDAALLTAGGDRADLALTTMRDGGRVTHPFWRNPSTKVKSNVSVLQYAESDYWKKPDPELIGKLNKLIELEPFHVHLDKKFSLDKVVEAHRAVGSHHLGRLVVLP